MGRRGSLTRQSPLLLLPLLLLLLLLNICTELGVFAVEVIGRPGENVTIRQGETAFLLCEIPSTAKQVAWLNRSAILFAKDLRWTQDQRISLERRSPTQYGLRVREVGLRDEGPYTCSLQGQGFPHTATLYLLVQVPPIITEISEDLTIDEGSNVTAFCSATGRPEPAVSWRHLSPSARMEEVEGEFLFLERVSRTQAGEYQCSAANDVTIADTRRLRLTVNYVPSDVEIRSTGMLLGRAGSLRCQASAVPLPWFTWSKEDHRLMDGLDGLRIRTEGRVSVLSFQNVTSHDYGNYSCSASNPLGTANASLLATRVTSLSYPVYSKGGGQVRWGSGQSWLRPGYQVSGRWVSGRPAQRWPARRAEAKC